MQGFSELRYISRFACLGPACPDHCCKDWRITIDRRTERRYRGLERSDLKRQILAALTTTVDKDGTRRTCIALDQNGHCPLFGADGLCSIQSAIGEAYLSYTCATFPRLVSGTAEHGFRAGTVACPEIAREVLEAPDAMVEVATGNSRAARPSPLRRATGPTLSNDEAAMVRTAMLKVLTTTRQPWLGRTTLATLFCRDLAALDLVRERRGLAPLVMHMHEVIDHADLAAVATGTEPNGGLLVKAFVIMLRIVTSPGTWTAKPSDQRSELVQSAIAGLQRDGAGLDAVSRTFGEVHEAVLRPSLAAQPQLQGNLFANLLLQRKFPHGRPQHAQRQFLEAVLCFTLWRVLLVGRLAHADGAFSETAHAVTYGLGRLLMHHATLIDTLHAAMSAHQMTDDPTSIALLA